MHNPQTRRRRATPPFECAANATEATTMKQHDCQYYWNRAAINYFADLPMERKLEIAEETLGKDELDHLKEMLKEETP